MEKDSKLQTTSQVTARFAGLPQSKGADEGTGLPPNGTFALWQMLMAIIKGEKQNLDNYAEMQKNLANSLGGANGIFAKLYDVGCKVGEEEAKGLLADAWGKFGAAIVSGGQLASAGLTYAISTRPQLNAAEEGKEDLNAFKEKINNSQAGNQIAAEEDQKVDPAVQKRINAWADGSKTVGIKSLHPNGDTNFAEESLNTRAAELADQSKRTEIQKKISEREKSLQDKTNNADQNFNSRVNMINMGGSGLQAAAQGIGAMKQRETAIQKARASASSSVIGQAQQGVSDQERKEQQAAEAAQADMNQWAISVGQAAASQYRG